MDDGRVAFLDFGMTKRLEPEQIMLEQRAVDAASRDDPGALREALDEIGFLRDADAIDAQRLMDKSAAFVWLTNEANTLVHRNWIRPAGVPGWIDWQYDDFVATT